MFEIRNINVVKNGRLLLERISLTVNQGEALVVLGENGAGKSVLLRSAACLEPGATGEVQFADETFCLPLQPGQPGPWPRVTVVLQHLALWPHLSGEENIRLPWGIVKPTRRMPEAELQRLFVRLDLLPLLQKLPSQMSGGERQRVAVARAIALGPEVLLLDEPSSALDARHGIDLSVLLTELKRQGTIVICSTHNLGFGSRIADRFIFIERGRIIAGNSWASLAQSASEPIQTFLALNAFPTATDKHSLQ